MSPNIMTTSTGTPVDNNQTTMTAGYNGPTLMQDVALIDKLAHFDRERAPERVVHAKGGGAHGYFECTKDMSKFTRAKFLNKVGKRTPLFARFSTVGGELGSADTARDPRGFALKFYTEEGNYDMVGNNTPVFFIRDPSKFPDFIHTQKRHPQTHLKDADMFWDFLSLVPESLHQVTILFSDRGTPHGFRHMHGYSSHTFKFVDEDGKFKYFKWHFRTDQGIKNFTEEEAAKLRAEDPDFSIHDLFQAIDSQNYPSWTAYVQIMEPEDAAKFKFNIFDVTKVWSQKEYKLHEVGKMVLNRNPENYFAEVEQAAFSPGNLVPGIEPTFDRMLQGRLFSYHDTHRHRLGANYTQLPINRAHAKVNNHQRDGPMTMTDNGGSRPNYEPNSFGGPYQSNVASHMYSVDSAEGLVARHTYPLTDDDFIQPGDLYRLMTPEAKSNLVSNIVSHLKGAKKFIQERQIAVFKRADEEYGRRVEEGLRKASAKV
ncbi:catalase A [Dimargaris xerosporica]|nr:catalase A [Dimargaris xerosporica]KAJ1972605.1 catalase A [Dimargaris xerosporica]